MRNIKSVRYHMGKNSSDRIITNSTEVIVYEEKLKQDDFYMVNKIEISKDEILGIPVIKLFTMISLEEDLVEHLIKCIYLLTFEVTYE